MHSTIRVVTNMVEVAIVVVEVEGDILSNLMEVMRVHQAILQQLLVLLPRYRLVWEVWFLV